MQRSGGLVLLVLLSLATQLQAQRLCARPGSDGVARPSGVINHYYAGPPGYDLARGDHRIPLHFSRPRGSSLEPGDLVLLIQMQGALINSSNTAAYGDGNPDTPAHGWTRLIAGHFEWLVVKSVGEDAIQVRGTGPDGGLVYSYISREPVQADDPGRARWQLVEVPQYSKAVLAGDLYALPWNGRTGGVLALDVRGVLKLAGHTLNAAARGFRGGAALTLRGALGQPSDYRYRAPTSADLRVNYGHHGSKGEGVAGTPRYILFQGEVVDTRPRADQRGRSDGYPGGSMARGAPGNAGGGGNGLSLDNQVVTGGGGGGGGLPGEPGLDTQGRPRGGVGGAGVPVHAMRLIAGGGGGAGARYRGQGVAGSGGTGGGIVVVNAGRILGPGTIPVAGADGYDSPQGAGGGGGGGGTIMLLVPFGDLAGVQLNLAGGQGGQAPAPGGDGGAGRLLVGGGVAMTPPSGVPTFNRLTARTIPGAAPAWLCRPRGTLISGVVFEDNGPGRAGLDGRQQPGEAGLGGWLVRVTNSQGRTLARTRTNRAGRYTLKLPPDLKGQKLRLQVRVPANWHAVAAGQAEPDGGSLVYLGSGLWRFRAGSDVSYDRVRLGMIRAPELDTPETRRVQPDSTQFFLLRYQAHTPGRVRFHYRGLAERSVQWGHAFFLDPDCDGGSEYVSRRVTRWTPVHPGGTLCVRVRLRVPEQARSGTVKVQLGVETDIGPNPLSFQLPVVETRVPVKIVP